MCTRLPLSWTTILHPLLLLAAAVVSMLMLSQGPSRSHAFVQQTAKRVLGSRLSHHHSMSFVLVNKPIQILPHTSTGLTTRTPRLGHHRLYSSTNPVPARADSKSTAEKNLSNLKYEDTPLGQNGTYLMDDLDQYTVPAMDDGHPLSVYGISSRDPVQKQSNTALKPILLLHGRTWSSVPVYHLLGGGKHRDDGIESRSLMEALLAKGLQPYCMDFRGFGGTHPDESGCVEPLRCVHDCETVLQWISERHGLRKFHDERPALLGWSQGALVAQLAAQKTRPALSKVILYGSIYDPLVRYPREPLYRLNPPENKRTENKFDDAIEDFTVEGTIPPDPARLFAEAALVADPIKAVWRHLYQFNNCDPARVHVPCLVVAGDQDPYCAMHVQQELFTNLGRESDRTWSILSGSDHACHLLDGRFRLINTVVSFVQNGKRTMQHENAGD